MKYTLAKILYNKEISPGIFEMKVKGNFHTLPGQFFMIRGWQNEPILSRPISIHCADSKAITFLYASIGKGTKILSKLNFQDSIGLLGPLGNGFNINKIKGKIAIITGGIGIAPMLYVAKSLNCLKIDLYSGFKKEVFKIDEFKDYVQNKYISTEAGDVGYKGYITDLLDPSNYDMILCCGPELMMKVVIEKCKKTNIPIYVSMENKMACGIGACLGCTCKTKIGNMRTCKDGPVFSGYDLIFTD